MVKVKFNPFTAEFDLVNPKGDSLGVSEEFDVDSGAMIGDVVKESLTLDKTVEVATNNTTTNRAIGVIIDKPTATTALVKVEGLVDGFSGLTRGLEIFLSPTGTLTSAPPATGYVQIMGFAVSSTEVFLEAGNFRAKRTP